jgi:uncharacterized delta-60 repeat protein
MSRQIAYRPHGSPCCRLLSLLLLGCSFAARGQDGSLDSTFQSPQFSVPVSLVSVEASGKILYLEGNHATLGRLTSTGSVDPSMNIGDGPQSITAPIDLGTIHIPGATNPATIEVILPLANGQILVGGSFSHFNKVARKLLVRLNVDGSVDTSFNQGAGFDGDNVYVLAVGPGDKIYAGGKFKKFNGAARNVALVRLNPDGSLDSSFADGTVSFGATVTGISIQPDGKVLVDTAYANASLQPTVQVYRLGVNGGLDATFTQGAGTPLVNVAPLHHGLMKNGRILVCGGSGTYNGTTVNSSLFRVGADGVVDTSYTGYTLGLVNVGGVIGKFLPVPDGSVYFSGAFDKVGGQPLLGLARLHPDGTLDPSFVPAVSVSTSPGALTAQPDGKLLVVTTVIVGTTPKYIIARLNGAGGTPAVDRPLIGPVTFLDGGAIQLAVSGKASNVVVESSSNLKNWSPLSTNSVANGSVTFSDSIPRNLPARFYRLLVAP